MKEKKSSPRKFFIKESNDIRVVGAKYFASISRDDALGIGVQIFLELQRVLKEDAVLKSTAYIGTIPLVEGLERSLAALEQHFPFILYQIRKVERRNGGMRLGQA